MNDQANLPPNYFYHRLSNGIEMVGQYMPSLSSITFGFQLDAAVVNEPDERQGLAHLFEYMLFQGTRNKDARALNEAFESLGARKGASTGLETAQVWAQIVNTKFDATLELVHELLLIPTFPAHELEPMRTIILQQTPLGPFPQLHRSRLLCCSGTERSAGWKHGLAAFRRGT